MNPLLLTFSALLVAAQFALPRRFAFVPLLIAACHTPYAASLAGQFSAVRLVLIAGILRAAFEGLHRWTPRNPLDLLIAIWSSVAIVSAIGHETGNPLQYRAGLVLNVLGTYIYARAFIRNGADFIGFVQSLAFVLVPLAGLLLLEAATGANAYHIIGSRLSEAVVRGDRLRATGPFGTPILAGTLGAVSIPLFVALWKKHRAAAILGISASLTMVATSGSSGPIGTLLLGSGALLLWRWRRSITQISYAVIALLLIVQLFRERSVWYLISLIDFVGGSTGWHRSRLLESAIAHLDEWWLFGTDYTRHWMPFGLPSIPEHCDLTSYYVHLGVIGGLPLVLTLLIILCRSFRFLGAAIRKRRAEKSPDEFLLWCAGSALFAHTVTFFTISYFDSLYVFFYALIAALTPLIASAALQRLARKPAGQPDFNPQQVGATTAAFRG